VRDLLALAGAAIAAGQGKETTDLSNPMKLMGHLSQTAGGK
jgi:hypothetical protein